MRSLNKKTLLIVLAAAIAGGGLFYYLQKPHQNGVSGTETLDQINSNEQIAEDELENNPEATVEEVEKPSIIERVVEKVERETKAINDTYIAKPTVLLEVAFASQAPFGNWDELHQEACEEASMIMAESYVFGTGLTESIMEQKIQDQVAWQTDNGYAIDITVAQAKVIMNEYYKIPNTEIINNPTADDLKRALSENKIIIVPAAGRLLGNPYFTAPGPVYHMLVVIGYDDKTGEFVTNDPGTRRGEKFRYDYDVFMNAIHDWNGGAEITQGAKRVLTVSK